MTNLINNIKKYFIYIVGIVFFIIAIYVMLKPPHSALNKMTLKEGFSSGSGSSLTMDYTKSKPGKNQDANNLCTINNKVVDSITCYRNIVSQNIQNPATIFDKDYLSHFNKALPDASAEKKLIMSRCYQINSEIYVKEKKGGINLINVLVFKFKYFINIVFKLHFITNK